MADCQRFSEHSGGSHCAQRVLGLAGLGPEILNLLRGSWDLVTRVIIKVTILIITYNPT